MLRNEKTMTIFAVTLCLCSVLGH